jgi:hypothetical protein
MLQTVATIGFVALAAGALALIVGVVSEDWRTILRALAARRPLEIAPLPRRTRLATDRRARVVGVSSQSVPRHAAA